MHRPLKPVFNTVLDEVAAHLDPLRRAALYERLAGQGGQGLLSVRWLAALTVGWLAKDAAARLFRAPWQIIPYVQVVSLAWYHPVGGVAENA